MTQKKTKPKPIKPFSDRSIQDFEKIVLTEYSFVRELMEENGTISQEMLGENLPSMRVAVFIQTQMPLEQKNRILHMLKTCLAASQVKIFYVSDNIDSMFSLNVNFIRENFIVNKITTHDIYFDNILNVMKTTKPQLNLLFSTKAYITDDLICFQVIKDKLHYTSEHNSPMQTVCPMTPIYEDVILLDTSEEYEVESFSESE